MSCVWIYLHLSLCSDLSCHLNEPRKWGGGNIFEGFASALVLLFGPEGSPECQWVIPWVLNAWNSRHWCWPHINCSHFFPCLCLLLRRKSWFCLLEDAAQSVSQSPARCWEEHSRWLVTKHAKTTQDYWHISLSLLPSLWLRGSTDSLVQTLLFSLLERQESWKKSGLDKDLLASRKEVCWAKQMRHFHFTLVLKEESRKHWWSKYL